MVITNLQSEELAQNPIKFLVTKSNPGKNIENSSKLPKNVSKLPRHVLNSKRDCLKSSLVVTKQIAYELF